MWQGLRRPREFLRGRGSLRSQLIWLTATASTVVVLLLGGLVQLVVSHTTNATVGQVLSDRANAVVSATVSASTKQNIDVPQARLEAGVAVYDADGDVVAGAVPDALRDRYATVAEVRSSRTLQIGDYARVFAKGFTTGAGVRGTVVVSETLGPYGEAATTASFITLGAGVLLIAASTGLVAFASRRVLAPVARMAHTAEEWSEHDLGRRFALGEPTNEITALGHTLDQLLDKVAATIRSEQRLTSELAHELRTPLTAVQGNAQLLQMNPSLDEDARADLEDILAGCGRMAATISGLIDLARTASSLAEGSTCLVPDVVEDVIAELDLDAPEDRVRLETAVHGAGSWDVPQPLAVRAMIPIVSNAAQHATSLVRISVNGSANGTLSVLVQDDGPGIDPSLRDRIFRPGETSGAGAGLGLALSRRIARMSGGDLTLDDATRLTTFRLTLPAAQDSRGRRLRQT